MIIAGVDYSTTGEHWSIFVEGKLHRVYRVQYHKNSDLAYRLAWYNLRLAETLYGSEILVDGESAIASAYNANFIAIEGYVHKFDRQGKLAGVHWHIRTEYTRHGRGIIELSPKKWRNEVGLPGNANKDAIKSHITKLYPELPRTLAQDAYDAVAIARAADRILRLGS